MSDAGIPVSKEGKAKLEQQLKDLENERPEIVVALTAAREQGDLSENADYDACKEALGMLDARIRDLQGRLSRAYIVDDVQDRDMVMFGATVKVKNHRMGKEKVYTLVGPGDDDPKTGRILSTSPIGQALLRKKVGEDAIAQLPVGDTKLTILEISYE